MKKYGSIEEMEMEQKFHMASKKSQKKMYGFILKNAKPFRVPIPWKGQLGLFDVDIPKIKNKDKKIVSDIIDEEYRYQWIGHH